MARGVSTDQASADASDSERAAAEVLTRRQEAETHRNRDQARFEILLTAASNTLVQLDGKPKVLSNLAARAGAGMMRLDPSQTSGLLLKASLLNRLQREGEALPCYKLALRNPSNWDAPASNP
jgi:hypothetical protein